MTELWHLDKFNHRFLDDRISKPVIKKSDEKVNKPRKLRGRVTEFDLSAHIFLAQIIYA